MPIAVITRITLMYAGSAVMLASATIGRRALNAVSSVRRGPSSKAAYYPVIAWGIAIVGSVSIVAVGSATMPLLLMWLVLIAGGVTVSVLKRSGYDGHRSLSSDLPRNATVGQLAALGRIICASLSIEDVWEELADLIGELISYDRISMATYDPSREAWTFARVRGVEVSGWDAGDVVSASLSIRISLSLQPTGARD